jgi:hypothetical protein
MFFIIEKSWSYGPMIIWLLLTTAVGFCIVKSSNCRTSIGYSALTAALAGFIYNIIAVVVTSNFDSAVGTVSLMILFYTIYTSFTFVPGLIAFRGISKQRGSKVGTYAANFGYFWAFVMVITGLVLTIMVGTSSEFDSIDVFLFVMSGFCGFVAINGLLLVIHRNQLKGKPNGTLIAYSLLCTLSVICFLITMLAPIQTLSIFFTISIIFFDLPMAAAIIIATLYGHLWKMDYLEDKVEVISQDTGVEA